MRIPKRLARRIKEKYQVERNTFKRDVVSDVRRRIDIEIGDSKQDQFFPQFKTKHWDNEANFSLRYITDYTKGQVKTEGSKVKWVEDKQEVHLYDLDIDEDGGYEIEILLREKPDTNVFNFSLQTKGLKFLHQPELTKEEIEQGFHRPDNVVGSYAVYHESKRNNFTNGKHYRTGKAFHIYRPHVKDAAGNETWAELSINERSGVLSVEVPQEYLNNAVYPVLVDPTFGYTSAGSSNLSPGGSNTIYHYNESGGFNIGTGFTVDNIDMYAARQSGSSNNLKTFIYSETGGVATDLEVSTSGVLLNSTSFSWKTFTPTTSPELTSGDYYIGFVADSNGWYLKYDSDASYSVSYVTDFSENFYSTPPDPFPTSGDDSFTFGSRKASLYATYTEASSPDVTVTPDAQTVTTSQPEPTINPGAPANPGDYLIRRNNGETDALAESTNFDSTWDTEVASSGTSISYSAGTFTLNPGKYLIMYAERWDTSDTTNNTRLEIQGRVMIDSVESDIAAGQAFIRKGSGQQEGIVNGAGIFDFSAQADIDIRFYRTDSSTTVDPVRVVDWGGVQIIALDDDWNYGRYSLASNTAANTSESTWATVGFDTNDEQDTGFSNSSGTVTITTAGKYLVAYSLPISHTSSSGRTEYSTRLNINGSEYEGTRVSTYMRGSESTQDGVLTFIGIVDIGASETIAVQDLKREGTNSTFSAGGNLQIVQLPSGAKTFRRTATSGDNNPSTATEFSWDVTEFEDTDTFTITSATDSLTEVDSDGDYLFFATLANEDNVAQRIYPTLRFSVNDTIQEYAAAGEYGRNSGTAEHPGYSTGIFLPGLTAGDDISVEVMALGASGTETVDHGSFSGVRIDDLFSGGSTDVTTTPDAQVVTTSQPDPTISTVENVTTSPDAQTVATSQPEASVSAETNITTSPDAQTVATSQPEASISTTSNVALTPGSQDLTVSQPDPSVVTVSNTTVSPDAQELTVSQPVANASTEGNSTIAVGIQTVTTSQPEATVTTTNQRRIFIVL